MSAMLINCVWVGIGGFAGSVTRYLLSQWLQPLSLVMPAGTLASNLIGCFVIGVVTQFNVLPGLVSPETRLLCAVGFCGGLTTTSSMIYETAQFLREGEFLHAAGYLALTLAGSMAAFVLGVALVRFGLMKIQGGLWN